MSAQTAFFDDERLSLDRALELTAESLAVYGQRYRHWAVAYSGGKDSTATLCAVIHLIAAGRVPAPASLTVLYADTRMELPPLHVAAQEMLAEVRRRGFTAQTVLPPLDDRFFVYLFGRGVPPPSNRFRWCTPQLKVEPMEAALRELRDRAGEKILMLTGVRIGESAARDQRIALSCGRDGSECGQGWFQEKTPESIADTLAPLLHWRVCLVWDWLILAQIEHGFPALAVAETYGMDADGSRHEVSARTGCVGCNLASRDVALDRLLAEPKWEYLAPLKRLKPLYAELKKPENRLRKQDERRADGSLVKNPGRLGPLTLAARQTGLAQVLEIQAEIQAEANGRPAVSLIDAEELERIRELIAANAWPNRWTGEEVTGDALLPIQFTRGGGRQFVFTSALFGEGENSE